MYLPLFLAIKNILIFCKIIKEIHIIYIIHCIDFMVYENLPKIYK